MPALRRVRARGRAAALGRRGGAAGGQGARAATALARGLASLGGRARCRLTSSVVWPNDLDPVEIGLPAELAGARERSPPHDAGTGLDALHDERAGGVHAAVSGREVAAAANEDEAMLAASQPAAAERFGHAGIVALALDRADHAAIQTQLEPASERALDPCSPAAVGRNPNRTLRDPGKRQEEAARVGGVPPNRVDGVLDAPLHRERLNRVGDLRVARNGFDRLLEPVADGGARTGEVVEWLVQQNRLRRVGLAPDLVPAGALDRRPVARRPAQARTSSPDDQLI